MTTQIFSPVGYNKQEIFNPELTEKLADSYAAIIENIGEDPSREGLLKTPERIAKAMLYMTQGYEMDAHAIL